MDLLLWRHADAIEGYPDHERALSPKGVKQAKRMAAWLNQHLPKETLIFASPALRTQQTAAALEREFKTTAAIGTSADCGAVLAVAQWPEPDHATKTVLIVGHQPTLGEVAGLLLAGTQRSFSVKKGAVWWLQSREAGGRTHAVLRAMMTPDLL